MNQTQSFNLNIVPRGAPPVVYACQYDTGARVFEATLYDDTGVMDLSGVSTAEVSGVKPDGTGFIVNSGLSINVNNSTITWSCTAQMTAVAGQYKCGLTLKGANQDRLGTLLFILDVQPAAVPVEAITSASDFETLVDNAVSSWLETNRQIARVYHYTKAPDGNPWGDANGDGVVNNQDYILASAQPTNPSSSFNIQAMDFNGDGEFTNTDLSTFSDLYTNLARKKIMKTVLVYNDYSTRTLWGLTD